MANRLKLLLIIGVTVCCGIQGAYSQDVHFSQFYANPLYLNPAFAGSRICPRIITNFREQWPSVTGDFMSYSASYDQHFDAISGGVGILFLGDQDGKDERLQHDIFLCSASDPKSGDAYGSAGHFPTEDT